MTSLYDAAYAERYRASDDAMAADPGFRQFSPWLARLSGSFGRAIDVLDLGCGTGRYFASLSNVCELVGLDASAAMLERAASPLDAGRITAQRVTLVHGDLLTHAFAPGRFDLVYSIGVLAEHAPLTPALVDRVAAWLRPGGLFAFSAVHPESPTVPRTWKRRLGRAAMPLAFGPIRRWLRERWCAGGLYADEGRIRELLASSSLRLTSLDTIRTVHLHCLVVAAKPLAA